MEKLLKRYNNMKAILTLLSVIVGAQTLNAQSVYEQNVATKNVVTEDALSSVVIISFEDLFTPTDETIPASSNAYQIITSTVNPNDPGYEENQLSENDLKVIEANRRQNYIVRTIINGVAVDILPKKREN